jgi:hypothetical protein
MIFTYAIAGSGLAVGVSTVYADPPSLTIAALMTVGAGGILSFLRHAVFHRSDAARMGWDYGTTNAFQIETGLANLAWGLVAVGAVIFGWGLAVEGAGFLVFGIYMIGASVAQVIYKRGVPMAVVSLAFGGMMTWIGLAGIAAA